MSISRRRMKKGVNGFEVEADFEGGWNRSEGW